MNFLRIPGVARTDIGAGTLKALAPALTVQGRDGHCSSESGERPFHDLLLFRFLRAAAGKREPPIREE
jgi:hypothetical protein